MPYVPRLISPIYRSIIRSVVDLIEDVNNQGIVLPYVEYHNWEERANEENLPQVPLLGTDGFSFNENDGLWIVRYGLALSSYRDQNLLNEVDLIDAIHARFGKGSKIPLRDLNNGEEVNELIVSEFQVLPMAQSELRNYRVIGLEVNRTGA